MKNLERQLAKLVRYERADVVLVQRNQTCISIIVIRLLVEELQFVDQVIGWLVVCVSAHGSKPPKNSTSALAKSTWSLLAGLWVSQYSVRFQMRCGPPKEKGTKRWSYCSLVVAMHRCLKWSMWVHRPRSRNATAIFTSCGMYREIS